MAARPLPDEVLADEIRLNTSIRGSERLTWRTNSRRAWEAHDPDRAHRQTTWHFINYPLRLPDFPDDPPREGDLLTANKSSLETLRDPEAPAVEKAISLAWLIHLVGDLHQPLHTATLINDNYPAGDRGGNDFYIRPNLAPVSLHDFLDALLGTSATFRTPHQNVIRLVTEFPRTKCPELKKSTCLGSA